MARTPTGMILAGVLGLALGLRVWGLGYGLPTAERIGRFVTSERLAAAQPHELLPVSVLGTAYFDEFEVLGGLSKLNPAKGDFNPDFYFWGTAQFYVLAGWLKVLSLMRAVSLVPEKQFYFWHPEEFAKLYLGGRILTVLFAVATVGAVYLAGKTAYDSLTGLAAAGGLAVMPFHSLFSHWVVFDIPMALWFAVSLAAVFRFLQTGRGVWNLVAGITAGLAMGTKYHGALSLVPLAVAHLLLNPATRRRTWAQRLRDLGIAAGLMAVTFVLTNPYVVLAWRDAQAQLARGNIFSPNVHSFLRQPRQMMATILRENLPMAWVNLGDGMGIGLAALACVGLVRAMRRATSADVVFVWTALVSLAAAAGFRYPLNSILRYQLPLMVLAAVLAARGAVALARRVPPPGRSMVVGIAAAAWVWSLALCVQDDCLMSQRATTDQAASWIAAHVPARSRIGVVHRYKAPPLDPARFELVEFGGSLLQVQPPDRAAVRSRLDRVEYAAFVSPLDAELYLDGLSSFELVWLGQAPTVLKRFSALIGMTQQDNPACEFYNVQPPVAIYKRRASSG